MLRAAVGPGCIEPGPDEIWVKLIVTSTEILTLPSPGPPDQGPATTSQLQHEELLLDKAAAAAAVWYYCIIVLLY